MLGVSPLVVLDDYFEGAGYSPGRADDFALGTPAALFRLDNSYNTINQHQGLTRAHGDTQPTVVALFSVYYGHFCQCHLLLFNYFRHKANYLYVTFVSNRCLHHFLESFFISNHNAVAVKPDCSFFFQGFERPADYFPGSACHSCHFLLGEPWPGTGLIPSVLKQYLGYSADYMPEGQVLDQ